ncbi:MAG TPA: hypothetical protein VNU26_09105 [Mycobacteriales bacterium]|nr:hypothetical protein [Mycobacteriales bacterium]
MSAEPVPAPPGPVRYHVQQKITVFANQYRVLADEGGREGRLVAFAKQKRMAFKEQFTLYADEQASRPVLQVKADRRIDVRSVLTVTDPSTGSVIGSLRKKGAASLLRSTWLLEQPGLPPVTVSERNPVVAVLRRVWGLIPVANSVPVPWVFHFDGTYPDGTPALSHTRRWGLRDRYVLEVLSPQLDQRLAIAMAVALDAMQKR